MRELEKGSIEKLNKGDKWNDLGNASDIHQMISILREILETEKKNGRITYTIEDETR
jgi:hypothetical protein